MHSYPRKKKKKKKKKTKVKAGLVILSMNGIDVTGLEMEAINEIAESNDQCEFVFHDAGVDPGDLNRGIELAAGIFQAHPAGLRAHNSVNTTPLHPWCTSKEVFRAALPRILQVLGIKIADVAEPIPAFSTPTVAGAAAGNSEVRLLDVLVTDGLFDAARFVIEEHKLEHHPGSEHAARIARLTRPSVYLAKWGMLFGLLFKRCVRGERLGRA